MNFTLGIFLGLAVPLIFIGLWMIGTGKDVEKLDRRLKKIEKKLGIKS